jgi:hypothetical protein
MKKRGRLRMGKAADKQGEGEERTVERKRRLGLGRGKGVKNRKLEKREELERGKREENRGVGEERIT